MSRPFVLDAGSYNPPASSTLKVPMTRRPLPLVAFAVSVVVSVTALAVQGPAAAPDWKALEDENLRHYQALIKFDTSASERAAAEYLKQVLDQNGIPAQILFKDPARPNVLARLKGTGRKRPLLLMGHIDTVTVDATKWRFPPFSATRDGGYVYGRGAIDDKDNLAAALMTMVLLKRQNVPLDRDVIFLAESGEEGASNLGIGYMMAEHYPEIDAGTASRKAATRFVRAERYDTPRSRPPRKSCAAWSSLPTASPDTGRYRSSPTRSPASERQWAASRPGSPRSGSMKPPAPTSGGWPCWRRPSRRSSIAM